MQERRLHVPPGQGCSEGPGSKGQAGPSVRPVLLVLEGQESQEDGAGVEWPEPVKMQSRPQKGDQVLLKRRQVQQRDV